MGNQRSQLGEAESYGCRVLGTLPERGLLAGPANHGGRMTSHPKTPLHLNDSPRSVHFTKHLSDLPPVISPEQAEADRVSFMEMAAREQAEREADNRRTYFRENYAKNRERRRKYQREYKRKRRAEGKDKKPVLTSPRTDAHRFN